MPLCAISIINLAAHLKAQFFRSLSLSLPPSLSLSLPPCLPPRGLALFLSYHRYTQYRHDAIKLAEHAQKLLQTHVFLSRKHKLEASRLLLQLIPCGFLQLSTRPSPLQSISVHHQTIIFAPLAQQRSSAQGLLPSVSTQIFSEVSHTARPWQASPSVLGRDAEVGARRGEAKTKGSCLGVLPSLEGGGVGWGDLKCGSLFLLSMTSPTPWSSPLSCWSNAPSSSGTARTGLLSLTFLGLIG